MGRRWWRFGRLELTEQRPRAAIETATVEGRATPKPLSYTDSLVMWRALAGHLRSSAAAPLAVRGDGRYLLPRGGVLSVRSDPQTQLFSARRLSRPGPAAGRSSVADRPISTWTSSLVGLRRRDILAAGTPRCARSSRSRGVQATRSRAKIDELADWPLIATGRTITHVSG